MLGPVCISKAFQKFTIIVNIFKINWHGSGIIYCRTRNECEHMVAVLRSAGIPSDRYHAGLSNKIRDEVQTQWMNNEVPLIVATIAFGMGVDKANVR